MFGLSYLFYPWGLIVQAIALVHFFRRRPENYWFYIIIFGGFLGASVYVAVQIIPDAGLLRGVWKGFGRRSRIQSLETLILDNPSAGNYEELGELYLEEKKFVKARDAFNHAISARNDSPHAFYHRAQASLGLNDPASAIPDLAPVVARDPKFDYYRAAGLLADAYSQVGEMDKAAALFAEVTQFSTTPETLYNYSAFLQKQGRLPEAREWTQKLLQKKRTLPSYMQRRERPWFRKAKSLQRSLNAQPNSQ